MSLAACEDEDDKKTHATDAGMDAGADGGDMELDAESPADSGPVLDARSDAGTDSAPADPYQCEPPAPPDGTIEKGAACCEGLGVCVEVGEDTSGLGVGDCDYAQNLRCLPVSAAGDAGASDPAPGDAGTGDAAAGGGSLTSCRMQPSGSAEGDPDYEGRCVPECLTRGISGLEQGECDADFVCVPCYNPVTGADTGACRGAGDAPADSAPDGFEECGDGQGYCVAEALAGGMAMLPPSTCPDGTLCAPKQRVVEPDSCFAECDSMLAGPGACIPAFLVPEAQRGFLMKSSCETGELCSPCINPLTQMRTGACD